MKGSNPEKKEPLATTESVTDRLGNSSVEKALKDTEMFMNPVCILSAMMVSWTELCKKLPSGQEK